ncbi:MAG: CBS domain-containing protein [Candidatus Brocadia sp.]|nr:MAG: CBS domain-containing protein [Candidatus Brocadia sp.]
MKHLDPISHVTTTNEDRADKSKNERGPPVLAENQIHHVPVVDGRRLSGMISTTDIIRLNITVSTADEWSIEEVMKRNLVYH